MRYHFTSYSVRNADQVLVPTLNKYRLGTCSIKGTPGTGQWLSQELTEGCDRTMTHIWEESAAEAASCPSRTPFLFLWTLGPSMNDVLSSAALELGVATCGRSSPLGRKRTCDCF